MRIYFFSFLSAEENYTSASIVHHGNKHSRCNYKGPNEGISFAGNASVGENQRRCLINQALDSSQSRPHPLPLCQWWGQLLTLPGALLPRLPAMVQEKVGGQSWSLSSVPGVGPRSSQGLLSVQPVTVP